MCGMAQSMIVRVPTNPVVGEPKPKLRGARRAHRLGNLSSPILVIHQPMDLHGSECRAPCATCFRHCRASNTQFRKVHEPQLPNPIAKAAGAQLKG